MVEKDELMYSTHPVGLTSPPSSQRTNRAPASVIVLEDYSDADMTVQRAPLRASDLPQFDLEPICDDLAPGADPNATVRRGAMSDSVAAIVLGQGHASHP